MAAAKRHSPTSMKKLYYKAMPTATTQRLARPTMMPAYDWTQTRAFALPTDQHGWIRINLKGREAQGIVSPEEYGELCKDLENLTRSLKRDDGKPLARTVIRTAGQVTDALKSRIPDLVVHWEDEVFASPLRIQDSEVVSHPTGQKYIGQHSLNGFCILRGPEELHDGDSLHAKDIHRLISKALADSRH
jgi:predicted AlkP superfamily phosphohydrolase/phosphomutase